MRSSSADRAFPVPGRTSARTDRAGWTRLGAAVLLGLVAAVGPLVGSTSAQFTDTDEVGVVSVTTPDDFTDPTPSPTSGPTSRVPSGPMPATPSAPAAGPGTGPAARPGVGPAPDPRSVLLPRPGPGPAPDGPAPLHHDPRLPLVR
ncbi:hypothetical protein [Cellulomonas sp. URHB0016]